MDSKNNYPLLEESYKNRFRFEFGTTSYIYPDYLVKNVRLLGPFLDQIELLLFESKRDSLPSEKDMAEIKRMGEEMEVSFNVHLPLDVSLTEESETSAQKAMEACRRVIGLCSQLKPFTWTLHLPFGEENRDRDTVSRWRERTYRRMEHFLKNNIEPSRFSIENLSYPFEWIAPVISDFGLSVCLDIGHLILYELGRPEAFFNQYHESIVIIHLHGVENGRDHISLDRMNPQNLHEVMGILERFKGIVSLEIFSFEDLTRSLTVLKNWHKLIKPD